MPSRGSTVTRAGEYRQGQRHVIVSAHVDEYGVCVSVRRHSGKPWKMTPELARRLAELLSQAADTADKGLG